MAKILVTGASGQLGAYILQELRHCGADAIAWSGSRSGTLLSFRLRPVDMGNRDALVAAYQDANPSIVIHSAAISRIDDCYRDPTTARRVNVEGTALLAELCQRAGSRLVYVSTDLIFDGAAWRLSRVGSPLAAERLREDEVRGRTAGVGR